VPVGEIFRSAASSVQTVRGLFFLVQGVVQRNEDCFPQHGDP